LLPDEGMKTEVEALAAARFDPASICQSESPTFVLIMGPVAVGKTELSGKSTAADMWLLMQRRYFGPL